ncbi:MAG: alpha/beta hydrolase [Actinomycetota bacterium]
MDHDRHDETPPTHLDIGTSRLGYRASGSGPDLLFIHGWPLNRETWRGVAAALGDFRCHLIDLPGCGQSRTPAHVPVSLEGHIDAVTIAIERLGLRSVTLVAQDSGGLVARNVAVRKPDVVDGLVLCGTEIPGQHPELIDRLQVAMRIPGAKAVTRALLRRPRTARLPQLLGGCFWDRSLIEGDFRTAVVDPTIDDRAIFDRQIEILQSYQHGIVDDLAAVHPRIECPVLLVWGEHDPFFPVEKARAMVDDFGGPTRLEIMADARLLAHEEHPDHFAALTRSFHRENQVSADRG